MPREHHTLLPALERILKTLGEGIRLARLRRQFSTTLVAERAGISRNTLRAIEHGSPNVTFGAYANVLLCLGLEKDLLLIAKDDVLGRKLQDLNLPVRTRVWQAGRKKKSKK